MTFKQQARRWINKHRKRIVTMYGLDHWTINLYVIDDASQESPCDMSDCKGATRCNYRYHVADIVINLDQHDNMPDLQDTVFHELEHVVTGSVSLYIDAVTPYIPAKAKPALSSIENQMVEMLRADVARLRAAMFRGLDLG
jgi:hypothetical protein